jgi:hypothetical protein
MRKSIKLRFGLQAVMLQMDRRAADNRRLAQWREKWLIEHSTSHQLLWCIDSFVLRNPPLRQAPNRYRQGYDRATIDKQTKQ